MKIGFFSRLGIIGPQEAILKEGHNLNVMWDLEKPVEDLTGLQHKYPGRITYYNGNIIDFVYDSDLIVYDYLEPGGTIKLLESICKTYSKKSVGLNPPGATLLERDRFFAKKVAIDQLGLSRYDTFSFDSAKDFIEVISSYEKPFVVKSNTKVMDSISTYIPYGKEDAIDMALDDTFGMFKAGSVTVEEFIDGYEVCIGGYYNGHSFGEICTICKEYKQALAGNMGNILTGEMGTVVKVDLINRLPERLKEVMRKLEVYLRRFDYRGFIDINTMITNTDIYMLEFTTRQGVPTECEIISMVDSYVDLLRWCSGENVEVRYDFDNVYVFGCVACYGIPFKTRMAEKVTPIIYGLDKINDQYQPMVAMYKDGKLRHRMFDRSVVVYGKGTSICRAREDYTKNINKVKSWNSFYRTDIGEYWINPKDL